MLRNVEKLAHLSSVRTTRKSITGNKIIRHTLLHDPISNHSKKRSRIKSDHEN